MRKVYAVSGGVPQIAKVCPDKTFQTNIKEAFDYALTNLRLTIEQFSELDDGSVASDFSDHLS